MFLISCSDDLEHLITGAGHVTAALLSVGLICDQSSSSSSSSSCVRISVVVTSCAVVAMLDLTANDVTVSQKRLVG